MLRRAQTVKQARHLGLDGDAPPGDFVRLGASHVMAIEHDPAGRWCQLSNQTFKKCALAGPVGSDQAPKLAFGDTEIGTIHRNDPAETHRKVVGLEEGRAGHQPSREDGPVGRRNIGLSRSRSMGTIP